MSHSAILSPAPFGRLLTAMVTPFDVDGQVDFALAARLACHLVTQGSDGIVVCGTTGESPTLSWHEQHRLLKTVRTAVGPDTYVLAGTGSNSTAEAVEATKEAAAAGAEQQGETRALTSEFTLGPECRRCLRCRLFQCRHL